HLICEQSVKTGSISLNGDVNVCPVLDGLSATPGEVVVGKSIELSATAHDSDSGPKDLAYVWSASSGSVSGVSDGRATFTCKEAGEATITVTASDGDPDPNCPAKQSVTVQCTALIPSGAIQVSDQQLEELRNTGTLVTIAPDSPKLNELAREQQFTKDKDTIEEILTMRPELRSRLYREANPSNTTKLLPSGNYEIVLNGSGDMQRRVVT